MTSPHRPTLPRAPASYQDLLDAPAHMVAELLGGVLHLHPRPALPHAGVAIALADEIRGPFDRGRGGPGGWLILPEPELHLGADVVVPDLAGWRRDRMAAIPQAPWTALAPDWLCEVLSPSTGKLDRTAKMDLYGRAGVGHLWLLDPAARVLEAFASADGTWTRLAALADEAEVCLPPFEAVGFPLSELWADLGEA